MVDLQHFADEFLVSREHRINGELYLKCACGKIFAAVLGRYRWEMPIAFAYAKRRAALEQISLSLWLDKNAGRWVGIVDGDHLPDLAMALHALGPDRKRVYLPIPDRSTAPKSFTPKVCDVCRAPVFGNDARHPGCNVTIAYRELDAATELERLARHAK